MGYVDPNTGGMVFQVLAAIFTFGSALILIFSRQIRRAFAFLRRRICGLGSTEADRDSDPPDVL